MKAEQKKWRFRPNHSELKHSRRLGIHFVPLRSHKPETNYSSSNWDKIESET